MTDLSTDPSTSTVPDPAPLPVDPAEVGAFVQQLFGWYLAAAATSLVDVGHRTGLFEALAAEPATVPELAARTGLSERHVREWAGGVATAGIVDLSPAGDRYSLPPARAAALAGRGPANLAPLAEAIMFLGGFAPAVARTLREGGGIPYADYQPEFSALQDGINRRIYDAALVDGYVAAVPGLAERLTAGATVLDVGCGTGHVVNLLARAFPASLFVGYDLAAPALAAARAEADAWRLTNARFELRDVASLPAGGRFDVVLAFDAIHDQARPRQVLREIRAALAEGGVFVMVDMNARSAVADNLGNPVATYFYWVSLFHCLQVSLAEGGEGLGTAWGVELATELLAEAGFGRVTTIDTPPSDPVNLIYRCEP